MKLTIDAADARAYSEPLRPPLRVGSMPVVKRHGLIVALRAGGLVGQGDYAPWPGFCGRSAHAWASSEELASLARLWRAHGRAHFLGHVIDGSLDGSHGYLARVASVLATLEPKTVGMPEPLRGAYVCALLDLLAQAWQVPLALLLAEKPAAKVFVHARVDSAWAAQNACRAGFTALKIKVGRRPLADEVATLCAIRSAVGAKVSLRLDGNGAWPQQVAVQALRLFAAASPAWMEQPVMDVAGLKALKELNIIPIVADESVQDEQALRALVDARAVDGVVLKPSFVGGPIQAVQLGRMAQAHGLGLSVTHALDSAVGRALALHVALALAVSEPCGLSTGDEATEAIEGGMAFAPWGTGLCLQKPVLVAARQA